MADRPDITIDQHHEQTALAGDDVTAQVRESGVEHIYYQFVTLSGRVMAKVVPAAHLARNMEKGVQFHGSAITDLVSDRHGNLIASGPDAEEFLALPDTSTFAVLPWAPNTGRFYLQPLPPARRRHRPRRAPRHLRPHHAAGRA